MRKRLMGTAIGVGLLALTGFANAHFVWIKSKPAGDGIAIQVGFGEPGAFDHQLVERIRQTQLTVVAGERHTALPLQLDQAHGCYSASAPAKADAIVAICDYGVVKRGDAPPFRLQYFAKRMLGAPGQWRQTSAAPELAVEIIPTRGESGVRLAAFADGKPLAKADLSLHGPNDLEDAFRTDESGQAVLPIAAPGEYAFYVGRTLPIAGSIGDKKFESVKQYATLTFEVPPGAADRKEGVETSGAKSSADGNRFFAADPEAVKLLVAARSNRNVWNEGFPGFIADINVAADGQSAKGAVEFDGSGAVELKLEGLDPKRMKSVRQILESMASHRLSSSGSPDSPPIVRFVKEPPGHPQGVLVEVADEKFHSSYRVRNNQIWAVNRQMGPHRMTISMLESVTTPDGRYLPGVYNVALWDNEGNLLSSTTFRDEWTTLGSHHVPKATRIVATGKSQWEATTLEFSNHRFLSDKSGN